VPQDAHPTELKAENEQLKQKLQALKALEEDLMAQRVFEKTRKLLVTYVTIGGFLLLLSGVVGVLQVVDYARTQARVTIDAVVAKESKIALSEETERQKKTLDEAAEKMRNEYATLGRAKQGELEKLSEEQATKLRSVGQPIGAAQSGKRGIAVSGLLDYTSEMGPVRDSGSEGSTVGFAVADALEYQIKKTSGKEIMISPRYIYYEARVLEGTTDQDAGTSLRDAIRVLRQVGAVAEDVWPYRAGEFSMKPPKAVEQAEHYKITQSHILNNSTEIKAALQRFGPVPGGFVMYRSAMSEAARKDGVIQMPITNELVEGGHAVCFVGFDDSKNMLKFKNQWTQEWGDQGYGYLPYEYADKFVSDAWAISLESPARH
jgi:C1A family cysteine protease